MIETRVEMERQEAKLLQLQQRIKLEKQVSKASKRIQTDPIAISKKRRTTDIQTQTLNQSEKLVVIKYKDFGQQFNIKSDPEIEKLYVKKLRQIFGEKDE